MGVDLLTAVVVVAAAIAIGVIVGECHAIHHAHHRKGR